MADAGAPSFLSPRVRKTGTTMSTEYREMVVHFYDELFTHGNLDVIDKYVGDEYIQR